MSYTQPVLNPNEFTLALMMLAQVVQHAEQARAANGEWAVLPQQNQQLIFSTNTNHQRQDNAGQRRQFQQRARMSKTFVNNKMR